MSEKDTNPEHGESQAPSEKEKKSVVDELLLLGEGARKTGDKKYISERAITLKEYVASGEPLDPDIADSTISFLKGFRIQEETVRYNQAWKTEKPSLDKALSDSIVDDLGFVLKNTGDIESWEVGFDDKINQDIYTIQEDIAHFSEGSEVAVPERFHDKVGSITKLRGSLEARLEGLDTSRRYDSSNADHYIDKVKVQEVIDALRDIELKSDLYLKQAQAVHEERARDARYDEAISILERWKIKEKSEEVPVEPEPVDPEKKNEAIVLWKPAPLMKVEPPNIVLPPDGPVTVNIDGRVHLMDATEIAKDMALKIAEDRLNEIIRGGWGNYDRGGSRVSRFFRGVISSLGRGFSAEGRRSMAATYGEEGYKLKFYNEALAAIVDNQDLMANIEARLRGESGIVQEGDDMARMYELLDAVIDEAEVNMLEMEERGETVDNLSPYFTDIVGRHLRGEFADRPTFEREVLELVNRLVEEGVIDREQFTDEAGRVDQAEGLMYASNLWDLAEGYRNNAIEQFRERGEWDELTPEQQQKMLEGVAIIGDLDVSLSLSLGNLHNKYPERPGERGGYLGWTDRLVNSVQRRPILGALFNPTTVGVAASMLTSRGTRHLLTAGAAGLGLATGFAAPMVVAGLAAGGVAYMKARRSGRYDMARERRNEALSTPGVGLGAEEYRETGYGVIAERAEDLITAIEAGDEEALYRAAALLQAETASRLGGNGVDLIWASGDEGERLHTNRVSKSRLKVLLAGRREGMDEDRVDEMAAGYLDVVESQYRVAERDVNRSAIVRGVVSGVAAGVISQAALEASDAISEHLAGETNNHITLMEYLHGQRATVGHEAFFTLENGDHIKAGETVTRAVTLPSGKEGTVDFRFVENGQEGGWEVVGGNLPPGTQIEEGPNGLEIVRNWTEMSHGKVSGRTWGPAQEHIAQLTGGKSEHISWDAFADNGTTGVHDGSELRMDFVRTDDGVKLDVGRSLGMVASGVDSHGNHFEIPMTKEVMSHMKFTIGLSPDHHVLQHEAVTLPVGRDGEAMAKGLEGIVFNRSGHVELKNGYMVTAIYQHDGQNISIMAMTNEGAPTMPIPHSESIPIDLPPVGYEAAVEATNYVAPEVVVPVSHRRPTGNPEAASQEESDDKPVPIEPTPKGEDGSATVDKPKEEDVDDLVKVPDGPLAKGDNGGDSATSNSDGGKERESSAPLAPGDTVFLTPEKRAVLAATGVDMEQFTKAGTISTVTEGNGPISAEFGGKVIQLTRDEVLRVPEVHKDDGSSDNSDTQPSTPESSGATFEFTSDFLDTMSKEDLNRVVTVIKNALKTKNERDRAFAIKSNVLQNLILPEGFRDGVKEIRRNGLRVDTSTLGDKEMDVLAKKLLHEAQKELDEKDIAEARERINGEE